MWALDDGSAGHDGLTGNEGQAILRALRASIDVRGIFTGGLSTGMRNDAPDEAVSQRQAWRLAEIAIEELAFVVLARALQSAGAGVEGEGTRRRVTLPMPSTPVTRPCGVAPRQPPPAA